MRERLESSKDDEGLAIPDVDEERTCSDLGIRLNDNVKVNLYIWILFYITVPVSLERDETF